MQKVKMFFEWSTRTNQSVRKLRLKINNFENKGNSFHSGYIM
jgi:aspartate carbamoyltransferase catalytic subunit